MNKKILVKILSIVLAFSFGLSGSGILRIQTIEAKEPTFNISIETINGYSPSSLPATLNNPISLSGNASSTKFPGQLSQYQVQVDWGDGTIDPDSNVSFTGSGGEKCDPPTGDKCSDFSGTWSSNPDHSYLSGGIYTITVLLHHSKPAGGESSDAIATVNINVVIHYACVNYACVVDTQGTYTTSDCNNECGTPPTGFNCVDYTCVASTQGAGTYSDAESCATACVVPATGFNCVDYTCVASTQGAGTYSDAESCATACRAPSSPTYYTCNQSNWTCGVSIEGTDLTTCQAGCQTHYGCNDSGQCVVNPEGQYLTDNCDNDCVAPVTTTTTTSAGAAASFGGQYEAVVLGAATQQGGGGQVAGASTACNPYLLKYIKLGADNDPEEVKKLESFLNEYLGVDLPVNGIYEEVDYNAVKQFQLFMKDDVLAPWVLVGCLPSDITPTGYVYRTTEWAINNMFCPISKPDVSDEKCEGGIIIGLGEEGTVLGESTTTPTTTTETTPLETTETTGANVAPENGVNPSQNWIWYLIGIMIIGGAVYLVYSKKNK